MKVRRVFGHWLSQRKVRFYLLEQTAIVLAFGSAAIIGAESKPQSSELEFFLRAIMFGFVFQSCFYIADLYDFKVAMEDRARGSRLLLALGAAAPLCWLLSSIGPSFSSNGALLAGVTGAAAVSIVTRAALSRLTSPADRVLIVGNGPNAKELAEKIKESGEYNIVGMVAVESGPDSGIHESAIKTGADAVLVACEKQDTEPTDQLLKCRLDGILVFSATSFSERAMRRLPIGLLDSNSLIYSDGFRKTKVNEIAKRTLDLLAALLSSIVFLPFFLFSIVMLKIDSSGPVFYSQERVGKDGRIFWLTKLRTMRVGAEKSDQPVWAQKNDDRVTRIGRILRKTRLDELPQIWAVLRGDMSFVGPRPERPYFVEMIAKEVPFYRLREAVKPGITGWAQLRYAYGASIEDARIKLEYDLYYVKNRSIFLDFSIIFHTVRHIILRRGAR